MKTKQGKSTKLQRVTVTIKDIHDAMRGNVHRNRKKYTRKIKHRNHEENN